ncbi:hypothetical protein ACVJGD_005532 [Bradyrhizobium sp. USDA 10063]
MVALARSELVGVAETARARAKERGLAGGTIKILPNQTGCEPSARIARGPAYTDEASCRLFLCARCRCQVLVCRRCDRGQIYCVGTCAQEARRDRQREARRRYQATPRGRAMHAERNRRYRARQRRMTDHGLVKVAHGRLSSGFDVDLAPASSNRPSEPLLCHHCGHPALPFLRLSVLHPRRRRAQTRPTSVDSRRLGHPPRLHVTI